ncbi:MAG: hypothetical protein E5V92_24605 [Mesorhizobium sp.]|uniref:hypothetical protein n=2 Tax=unclassified Mesorhizobium TaxID=325217 RepID=UPI000F76570B|nr:hypothetical protein [Mesorhizobium sp. M1D.F.Ca.ET.043.01.1.1]RWA88039.1 MAG: hypothetical protein EOQ32_23585 [Mesorhizobium sp.]AZO70417.1 hypothetical protein EJ067_03870 [Mesorhizobium sp. M1D.F.Ca.ET.043.01.1.1]RWD59294.1 MAG: hypothetical protein EOS36_25840 [Mesorhizobium sp.]RWE13451.1 MAG: hypothetical protein EOS61_13840 [Mesorhizobium sp.]RWE32999.1 MAG: hypothetical protein EOS79_30230 [Mesorhizobium sp.]
MMRTDKARPFVPTEIHVGTVRDEEGAIGILSIRTTEGLLDIALDRQAAEAIVNAIGAIRSKLDAAEA